MNELLVMEKYLSKHGLYPPLIQAKASNDLQLIVVIPSFDEVQLITAIESLISADPINAAIEIIIILNHSENCNAAIKKFHEKQYHEINQWITNQSSSNIKIHCPPPIPLNAKKAGVGLARKIGMDEAIRRFAQIQKPNGVIINFDADCICHKDYWKSIYEYFLSPDAKQCLSLAFEHLLIDHDGQWNHAIIDYELHLRYYIQAQKFIGYPFAYQTLGSCFAVQALAYCAQGGMNQRQAGEDFYFMHKFSAIHQLSELNEVLVYPSSRISTRVPFGTGRAMENYQQNKIQKTYSLDAILLFGKLINKLNGFYLTDESIIELELNSIHPELAKYFIENGLPSEIVDCKKHSANQLNFYHRLLRWFNPFCLMKYLHHMREKGWKDTEVLEASKKLLALWKTQQSEILDIDFDQLNKVEILHILRKISISDSTIALKI